MFSLKKKSTKNTWSSIEIITKNNELHEKFPQRIILLKNIFTKNASVYKKFSEKNSQRIVDFIRGSHKESKTS